MGRQTGTPRAVSRRLRPVGHGNAEVRQRGHCVRPLFIYAPTSCARVLLDSLDSFQLTHSTCFSPKKLLPL